MRLRPAELPLHPLLLASYAVLFLYAQNIQLVRLAEVLPPLAWSVLGAAVMLGAFGIGLRSARRGAVAASGVVIAFFGYGHVTAIAGAEPSDGASLMAWLVFVAAATGLAVLMTPRLPRLTVGLNVVGAVLVAFTLATIVPHHLHQPLRARTAHVAPSGLAPTRTTDRDIYYLVFDRYGSESSLRAGFGIADNDLPAWLADRGFYVADRSHANYVRTTLSLAAVLNLDYIDAVARQEGPHSPDYGPLDEMVDAHLVGRFLREQGYRYFHVGSWWAATRSSSIADESSSFGRTTEFEAVLHDTTVLPALRALLPADEPMPLGDETHVTAARFQFRELPRVIDEPGAKFVMAHVLLPHDPYTFDEAGRYVSRAERRDEPLEHQYERQLRYTNREIKSIVERLLARPAAERPIIVLQADEGPYPTRYHLHQDTFDWGTATPAELVTKFGILNALYLPPDAGGGAADSAAGATGQAEPYPTMSSVNTFRLILGRYFGLDLPLLPDRVFTSRSRDLPYDLTEVTDLLAGR